MCISNIVMIDNNNDYNVKNVKNVNILLCYPLNINKLFLLKIH